MQHLPQTECRTSSRAWKTASDQRDSLNRFPPNGVKVNEGGRCGFHGMSCKCRIHSSNATFRSSGEASQKLLESLTVTGVRPNSTTTLVHFLSKNWLAFLAPTLIPKINPMESTGPFFHAVTSIQPSSADN